MIAFLNLVKPVQNNVSKELISTNLVKIIDQLE